MRRLTVRAKCLLAAVILVGLSVSVQAATVVVPLDQPVADLASYVVPVSEPKLDLPAQGLFLPFFEVNKMNPAAETSLFSVRNISTTSSVGGAIVFYDVSGSSQGFSPLSLDPGETRSVNLNDVPLLEPDPDGIARGYVIVETDLGIRAPAGEDDKGVVGPPPQLPALVGDYFQVIQNEDFATGDRLKTLDSGSVNDFCQLFEARFLNGGAFSGGTDFVFLVASPQGDDPGNDPPSLIATVVDEAGATVSSVEIYTSDTVVKMPASTFTGTAFGTLDVAFNGGLGVMTATYSALGRFSVGMDAACKDRNAGDF